MSALRDERRDDETTRTTPNERTRELLVERSESVIIEPVTVDGREMTRYAVVPRERVESTGVVPGSIQDVLNLAGAWSDIDWHEAVEFFERIRHETPPSRPLEFDDEDA